MAEKKELLVVPVGALKRVKYAGGGELPKELQGLYTSDTEAHRAINRYLLKRDGEIMQLEVKENVAEKAQRRSK